MRSLIKRLTGMRIDSWKGEGQTYLKASITV